jgi:signal transduction histidine kinase
MTLSDTGVGIPEESVQKIFAPFFSTKANGVGLGLNICKQIVDAHGGDITLRSKQGAGSIFTVKLPIRTKQLSEKSTLVGTFAEKNEESARNRSAGAS